MSTVRAYLASKDARSPHSVRPLQDPVVGCTKGLTIQEPLPHNNLQPARRFREHGKTATPHDGGDEEEDFPCFEAV